MHRDVFSKSKKERKIRQYIYTQTYTNTTGRGEGEGRYGVVPKTRKPFLSLFVYALLSLDLERILSH